MGIRVRTAVVATACVGLVACGASSGGTASSSSSPSVTSPSSTASPSTSLQPFVPATASETYRPTSPRPGAVPVVLMIPGGGWQTSNREYMAPLAQRLAADGAFVVNSTYRAGDVGAMFPVALQDVLCAAGYAVAQAKAAGLVPGPVILVGHSAGGHLVALAGVSGDTLAAPCADPVPHVDGVVGMAGVYDAADAGGLIAPFFGVARAADPALWDSGDPIRYVEDGRAATPLSVLLVHGSDDDVVPLRQSQSFAAALKAAGIPVRLDEVADADHNVIVDPAVSGAAITAFVRTLASTSSATG